MVMAICGWTSRCRTNPKASEGHCCEAMCIRVAMAARMVHENGRWHGNARSAILQ